MQKQLKVKENFYLIEKSLSTQKEKKELKQSVNHLLICDISGSMYHEIDKLRFLLKNKIPKILTNDGDTISILWFSSKNECGCLQEEVEIKNILQLESLNKAIDTWLKPLSLTAFAPPLKLAKEVIDRIKKNRPNSIFSLQMFSDGQNNDSQWSEVIKYANILSPELSSSCFIEFGFYTNPKQVMELTETLGAEKVLAENFHEYEIIFENKLSQPLSSSKKIFIEIPAEYRKFDFAFTINENNDVLVYLINENNTILIPEETEKIFYFNSNDFNYPNLDINDSELIKSLYASVYVLTDKNFITDSEDIYAVLGDKYTFDIFVNAFGRENLNNFKKIIKNCITDESQRFISGRVDSLIVDENAYCIMNLIDDLTLYKDNLFYPSHESWDYNRVGLRKTQKENIIEFSDEDKNLISSIKDIKELNLLMESLEEKYKPFKLDFVATNDKDGFRLDDLTWNSTRANLSVKITYYGTIKLPKNKFGLKEIETKTYRNLTILRDGLKNIKKLPVSLNKKTFLILQDYKVLSSELKWKEGEIYVIDLTSLPVVNRSMTNRVSAEALARLEFDLYVDKVKNKVFKYYEKNLFPFSKSKGFVEQYGEEATVWLKEIGITEANGFSPKTESVEAVDFYMSVNLETKLAGLSSIPKVEDIEVKLLDIMNKKDDKDKVLKDEDFKGFKISDFILAQTVKEYLNQLETPIYKAQTPELQKQILEKWVKDSQENANKSRRELMQKVAQIKFSLILAKKWFLEFKSMDENEMELELVSGQKPVKIKFEMTEKEEKI